MRLRHHAFPWNVRFFAGPLLLCHMRDGWILLHRQGLTPDDWKNPMRTLAWIDFLTLADYENAIVTASYGFLATRWRCSKGTVHFWIKHWIAERQVERLTERSAERNAERFFIVNYAKYQRSTERVTERPTEREAERVAEPKKKVSSRNSREENEKNTPVGDGFAVLIEEFKTITNRPGAKILLSPKRRTSLKKRLEEFTRAELVASWHAMAADPWLTGENDRDRNFLDIDYALRSDRIEHWLTKAKEFMPAPAARAPRVEEEVRRLPDGTKVVSQIIT